MIYNNGIEILTCLCLKVKQFIDLIFIEPCLYNKIIFLKYLFMF